MRVSQFLAAMGLGIVSDWRNCGKTAVSLMQKTIYRPRYFHHLQADCQPQPPFARPNVVR
jgi:hypothetical protein